MPDIYQHTNEIYLPQTQRKLVGQKPSRTLRKHADTGFLFGCNRPQAIIRQMSVNGVLPKLALHNEKLMGEMK